MKRVDLHQAAAALEPTFSPGEVGEFLGLKRTAVFGLIRLGRQYRGLHPTRGGLYPTFHPTHKTRRIPRSAIERHLRHMARLAGESTEAITLTSTRR
jgi:hypothetical protein